MPTHPLLSSPADWTRLRQQALRAKGQLVLLALVSLEHCPYCKLLIREQLVSRIREGRPAVQVLEFDLSDSRPIAAEGSQPLPSPREWARRHRFKLAPTVTAITPSLSPVGSPLLGYSSLDFYSAYLEDLILAGRASWTQSA